MITCPDCNGIIADGGDAGTCVDCGAMFTLEHRPPSRRQTSRRRHAPRWLWLLNFCLPFALAWWLIVTHAPPEATTWAKRAAWIGQTYRAEVLLACAFTWGAIVARVVYSSLSRAAGLGSTH